MKANYLFLTNDSTEPSIDELRSLISFSKEINSSHIFCQDLLIHPLQPRIQKIQFFYIRLDFRNIILSSASQYAQSLKTTGNLSGPTISRQAKATITISKNQRQAPGPKNPYPCFSLAWTVKVSDSDKSLVSLLSIEERPSSLFPSLSPSLNPLPRHPNQNQGS